MIKDDKYLGYSENDFICDEYFQDWIVKQDEQAAMFWKNWVAQNPGKTSTVENARVVLQNLQFKEHWPSEEQLRSSLEKSLELINSQESSLPASPGKVIKLRYVLRVAAILILMAGISVIWYQYSKPSTAEVFTMYGNMKQVILPDSTTIVLNSNSKIRYHKKWKPNEPRQIWLEGEAFFNVKHLDTDNKIAENERFIVHTKNVTVEVLGTAFDIRQRRGKTEVVLQTGKIKLSFKDQERPDMVMTPGQIVSIDPSAKNYVLDSTLQADEYVAWVDKKLVLNNASLRVILEYLEDNYGRKIILQDTALNQRKIEGTIMLDNLDDALFVLSKVLNVNIVKQDSTIRFMTK